MSSAERHTAGIVPGSSPSPSGVKTTAADLVCISGGWSPTIHLTSHQGVRPRWRDDIDAFAEMNEVYRTYFPSSPPARTTVGIAALPGGAAIEIALVAVSGAH